MVKCTCGYISCKKFYETEKKKKSHLAGVKAAKIKKSHKNNEPSTNKKEIISAKDCLIICKELSKIFSFIQNIRERHSQAKIIPNPKIPNTLSEPIIVHLLYRIKFIPDLINYDFQIGSISGNGADISAINRSQIKKLQVKATGKSDFITIGEKDMKSDYFIWIRFEDAFTKNDFSKLKLFYLEKPHKNKKLNEWNKKNTRISFPKLKELIGKVELNEINLEKILKNP